MYLNILLGFVNELFERRSISISAQYTLDEIVSGSLASFNSFLYVVKYVKISYFYLVAVPTI